MIASLLGGMQSIVMSTSVCLCSHIYFLFITI